MYSNTFYGGTSSRPGPTGFGQQQPPPPQQQQQQQPQQQPFPGFSQPQQQNLQPGAFMPQATGFAGSNPMQQMQMQMPMQQPQPTGFPPSHQFTGFPLQNQQPPSAVTAVTQQQLSAPLPNPPHETGMTSTQIAHSFAQPATPAVPAQQHASSGSKIPNMRLSFITAQDQAKFEQLFKSAVGNNQALDGACYRIYRLYYWF